MKYIFIIIGLLTFSGWSQGLKSQLSLNKYLKCLNDSNDLNCDDLFVELELDETMGNSFKLKYMYGEACEEGVIGLDESGINQIGSTDSIVVYRSHISNMDSLHSTLKTNKQLRYKRKYGISKAILGSIDNNLEARYNELTKGSFVDDPPEIYYDDDYIDSIDYDKKEKNHDFLEKHANYINSTNESKYLENLMKKTDNQIYILDSMVIGDSTIQHIVEIGFGQRGFRIGQYYDEDVYYFLLQKFMSLVELHDGKELLITVVGKADAHVVTEGIDYPDQGGWSWGEISMDSVLTYIVGTDSSRLEKSFLITPESDLSNLELAAMRAYLSASVVKRTVETEPYVIVTDYEEDSQKFGSKYRTTGFMIIVSHDINSFLKDEMLKDRVTKIGGTIVYINENGKMIPFRDF